MFINIIIIAVYLVH